MTAGAVIVPADGGTDGIDERTLEIVLAAVEESLRLRVARSAASTRPANRWRFSGRDWTSPAALRRERPRLGH